MISRPFAEKKIPTDIFKKNLSEKKSKSLEVACLFVLSVFLSNPDLETLARPILGDFDRTLTETHDRQRDLDPSDGL